MKLFAPLLAITLLSVLSACSPSSAEPAPPASATASESASDSPAPVDDAEPEAAKILLKTLSFFILDEDGEILDEFDYFAPAAPVVARLSEVFGGDPLVTPFAGNPEQSDGILYTWDGLTLKDWNVPAVAYWQDFDIIASSPVVRGITVVGAGEVGVGATAEQATAAGASYIDTVFDEPVPPYFELDSMPAPDPEWAEWYDGPRRYVLAELSGEVIVSITAPDVNYGP